MGTKSFSIESQPWDSSQDEQHSRRGARAFLSIKILPMFLRPINCKANEIRIVQIPGVRRSEFFGQKNRLDSCQQYWNDSLELLNDVRPVRVSSQLRGGQAENLKKTLVQSFWSGFSVIYHKNRVFFIMVKVSIKVKGCVGLKQVDDEASTTSAFPVLTSACVCRLIFVIFIF